MVSLVKYSSPILVEIPNLIREIPNLVQTLQNFQLHFTNLKDLPIWNFHWYDTMQSFRLTLQKRIPVSPSIGTDMPKENSLFARGLWRNHKRKVIVSLGVFGGAYFLYQIYEGHRSKIANEEKCFDRDKAIEEVIRSQLQSHFESTQKISDSITLPSAMFFLREKVTEKLELSYYMDKLMQPKDVSNQQERIELWKRVKVLSFTRATTALWTTTLLTLYSGVQVNILGRHLYLEMARSDGSASPGEGDTLGKIEREEYLATADYLSTYGIDSLIMNMRSASSEVINEEKVNTKFSMEMLRATMTRIIDKFMGVDDEPGLYNWINYLLPESANQYRDLIALSMSSFEDFSSPLLLDHTKLEQLIAETRDVLASEDFKRIVDISLRKGVDMLIEEIQSANIGDAIPLAKLLPRVSNLSAPVLEDPSTNKFIHALRNAPEVQLFYTFLYANILHD